MIKEKSVLNGYEIMEQRIGWGYLDLRTSDLLLEVLTEYNLFLYESDSGVLGSVTALKTFEGVKSLVIRRLDEYNEFIDDEYFEGSDVFNDYIKEVEACTSLDRLCTVLDQFRYESAFELDIKASPTGFDPSMESLEIVTWDELKDGARDLFILNKH